MSEQGLTACESMETALWGNNLRVTIMLYSREKGEYKDWEM